MISVNLRTKFIHVGILLLGLPICLGGIHLVLWRQLSALQDQAIAAQQIQREVFELALVAYNLSVKPSPRASANVDRQLHQTRELVEGLDLSNRNGDLGTLAFRLACEQDQLEAVASELIRLSQGDAPLARPEWKQRVSAELIIQAHSVVSLAERLQQATQLSYVSAQRRAGYLSLSITAVMVAIIGLSLLVVYLRIGRPIRRLAEAVDLLKQGRFDIPPLSVSRDEIGQLSRDFMSMSQELDRHRTDLEGLVTARTDELRQSRSDLAAKAEELTRSNLELQQFAYVASHDLKEPLRVVTNYAQLLEKRYDDQLDEKGRRYLHYMSDAARRMRALIDGLLSYSRVGTRGAELGECDAGAALDDALQNLEVSIQQSQAEIDRSPLPRIHADYQQLVQLFQNLIGNALKFAHTGSPRIQIRAEQIDPAFWQFSVVDNGPGIPPEFHERAFRVFDRLAAGHETEGTGIGLAICQRIVERHGGRIWIDETAQEGTTFHFTLPRSAAAIAPTALVLDQATTPSLQ